MFRCYITGIELNSETAYVLDIAKVMRMMVKLKNKYNGMEKMLEALRYCDNVELVTKNGKRIKQKRRRLICRQLADAYSETFSEKNLFVPWKDWINKKHTERKINKG